MNKEWNKMNATETPSLDEISNYVNSPFFDMLCHYLEDTYKSKATFEFSRCSKPGWNIKYKKSGKSLCTIYPMEEYFTALVVIRERDQIAFEEELKNCSEELQILYDNTKYGIGQKWLMIDVNKESDFEDVKKCIQFRYLHK